MPFGMFQLVKWFFEMYVLVYLVIYLPKFVKAAKIYIKKNEDIDK